MRKRQDYIFLYVKGMMMGAAEVIPGVSASTAALIAGVYEELVTSIRSIDREAIRLLSKFKVAAFWKHINGNFIITIFAGMITSLLAFSRITIYILKYNPILIGAFFFSLILISAPLGMREEIKKLDTSTIVCFVVALLVAYTITLLPPAQAPPTLWFILLVGVLAGSGAFIPGMSVTFILIILGQYQYLTSSLGEFNMLVIFIFISAYFIGLAGFSRFLSYIVGNYPSATLALLTGFMVGSLNKVWPWRDVFEFVTNRRGEQVPAYDKSILPWDYFAVTGKDPQVFQAILMMALGVFIVVLIEKIASRLKTKI